MGTAENYAAHRSPLRWVGAIVRVPRLLLATFLEFFAFFVRLFFGAISVAAVTGAFALHYLISKPVPSTHFWLLIAGGLICAALVMGYDGLIKVLRGGR